MVLYEWKTKRPFCERVCSAGNPEQADMNGQKPPVLNGDETQIKYKIIELHSIGKGKNRLCSLYDTVRNVVREFNLSGRWIGKPSSG
jgi:hypothetical protein